MRNALIAALLLLAGPLLAAESGLDYNLVNLQADAEAEVPNDQMRVTLVVEHEAPDAAALAGLVNADMGWALEQARRKTTVRSASGRYNTFPEYASTRIVGWRAVQELVLESEDFGAITGLVTDLQARMQVRGMQFVPTRTTRLKVEEELTTKALEAFSAKAAKVAATLGRGGYEIVEIHVGSAPGAMPMRMPAMQAMRMEADAAPLATEAGTATLAVTVSGRIQVR